MQSDAEQDCGSKLRTTTIATCRTHQYRDRVSCKYAVHCAVIGEVEEQQGLTLVTLLYFCFLTVNFSAKFQRERRERGRRMREGSKNVAKIGHF